MQVSKGCGRKVQSLSTRLFCLQAFYNVFYPKYKMKGVNVENEMTEMTVFSWLLCHCPL